MSEQYNADCEYIAEKIYEICRNTYDLWILETIHRFAAGMTKPEQGKGTVQ